MTHSYVLKSIKPIGHVLKGLNVILGAILKFYQYVVGLWLISDITLKCETIKSAVEITFNLWLLLSLHPQHYLTNIFGHTYSSCMGSLVLRELFATIAMLENIRDENMIICAGSC